MVTIKYKYRHHLNYELCYVVYNKSVNQMFPGFFYYHGILGENTGHNKLSEIVYWQNNDNILCIK